MKSEKRFSKTKKQRSIQFIELVSFENVVRVIIFSVVIIIMCLCVGCKDDEPSNGNNEGGSIDVPADKSEGCNGGHNFSSWITVDEPSCTESGKVERVCSCGEKESKQLNVLGHKEGDWTVVKEATATEAGKKQMKCVRCGEVVQEAAISVVESLGLAYSSTGTTCSITGIGECTDKEIVIPKSINGLKVISIGEKAFENQTHIMGITIPDSVVEIGARAFYGCTGLTEIQIPSTVAQIGTQIFYKASNLHTVYYDSAYYDEQNDFLNLSHIKKIVFGGKSLNAKVISDCTNIKEVVIDGEIKSVPKHAFREQENLERIVIGKNVASIGVGAFYSCVNLTDVSLSNGLKSIEGSAFAFSGITKIELPESVTSISDAFSSTKITSISLPNGISIIEDCAFIDCVNLTGIEIPDSVTSIEYSAFYGCTSLKSVSIPDSVRSVGASAFENCTTLGCIVIPDSVVSIGINAFEGCTALASVKLGKSVKSIGHDAFAHTSISTIEIPDGIVTISEYTFFNCTNLKSVVIPKSVNTIYGSAFMSCASLTDVYYTGSQSEWNTINIYYYFDLELINATKHYNYVP